MQVYCDSAPQFPLPKGWQLHQGNPPDDASGDYLHIASNLLLLEQDPAVWQRYSSFTIPGCTWRNRNDLVSAESPLVDQQFEFNAARHYATDGQAWFKYAPDRGWQSILAVRVRDPREIALLRVLANWSGPLNEIPKRPLICVPANWAGNFGHAGDTFRELVAMWEGAGFVRTIRYSQMHPLARLWGGHVWLGPWLLYDRPTEDWLLAGKSMPPRRILSGNTVGANMTPWIFWARHPKALHAVVQTGHAPYHERPTKLLFIGKWENHVQAKWRLGERKTWAALCDEFYCERTPKYSQEKYLERLRQARFGLSLRGFGPKCNREIEYLALGVVMVVPPEVDTEGYHEPLVENVHYLRANSIEEAQQKIAAADNAETWTEMSKQCIDWYNRNAAPEGAFRVTMRLCKELR